MRHPRCAALRCNDHHPSEWDKLRMRSTNRCAMLTCTCSCVLARSGLVNTHHVRNAFFPPCLLWAKACMGPRHGPATLLAASANLQLEIHICAVYLFQNVSVLPYHSVYESVLAFVEPLLLILAEACPRSLDKTHPEPVTKKQITYRPSSSSPQLLLCVRRSRAATVC